MPYLVWIPFTLFLLLSAAIIMDRNSCASYINNNHAFNQHHGVQNTEQVKQLLVHLDAARYKLEVENQILETKLLRLQELIVVMRRERDEALYQRDQALDQLYSMKQQMIQQQQQQQQPYAQTNIISKAAWGNKAIGSSPLGLESVPAENSSRSLIVDEVDWEWHHPVRRFDFPTDPQDDFIPNSSAMDDMMDRSDQKQPVFDFAEDVMENGQEQNNNNNDDHDLSFLNQDEENSDRQQHDPVDHITLRRIMENQNHNLWENETPHALRNTTSSHSMAELSSSCMAAYTNQAARMLSPPMESTMPIHLPEPPEADPDVMLSTLPERGKFLEAVMHAGPLLNTLLLAGPLPQWRHPPPALQTVEIPMLSMPSPPSFAQMQSPHMTSSYSQPVTSPLSPSHHNDIKDPQQFPSSSSPPISKFLCWPAMNSQDTAMMGSSMKFAKIH